MSHDINNILINSSWKVVWVSQDQGDFGFENSNKYNDVNDEVEVKKIYLKRGESLKQSRLKAGNLVSIQNPEKMKLFVFFIFFCRSLYCYICSLYSCCRSFNCHSLLMIMLLHRNTIFHDHHKEVFSLLMIMLLFGTPFFHDHHDQGCYSQGGKRLEVPKCVSCDGANLVVAQVSETRY